MENDRERILAAVDRNELVELAMRLAEHRSFPGEEEGAARCLGEWMEKRGLEVSYQEVEKNRFNVIGRLPGKDQTNGRSLMFNGHLDIDPVTENFGVDPWDVHVEGSRLWGHGLRNMKAGVASMAAAAAAICRAGVNLAGDIYVAGVIGELQGGIGTKALIEEAVVPQVDYAVVTEPSNLKIRTVVAGVVDFLIHVQGLSGWIGRLHEGKTVNAIEKACKVVQALKSIQFRCEPRRDLPNLPKAMAACILGGVSKDYLLWSPAYVPDYCTILYEVRMLPGQTFESVADDIRHIVSSLQEDDPQLNVEIEGAPGPYRKPWGSNKHNMPPAEIKKDSRIVRTLAKNHREVTNTEAVVGPEIPGSYAGNDMSHLIHAGIEAVTYGPAEEVRAPDHFVDIDKMMYAAQVLALTAQDICS